MGYRYRRIRTNQHFYAARGTAFFARLPIARVQRSLVLEYIRAGKIKPWYFRKEQVIGAPVTLHFDYQPRPVRLVGTVMDAFCHQTSLKGGIKVYARTEATSVMTWVPFGNPRLRHDIQQGSAKGGGNQSGAAFENYLNERDRWDEAWITGKARLK